MPTITVNINESIKFNVEYENIELTKPLGSFIDIKNIYIGSFELDYYSFVANHDDLLSIIKILCEKHFKENKVDADDLKNIKFK